MCAYLCLVTQAVCAVDPDVLSKNFAALIQLHVLRQLERSLVLSQGAETTGQDRQVKTLTLEALETTVDSPTPAACAESV